ncbi:AfsA-related hotdog domain-containing protein [Actinacidiphila sp. ITFR-21]|uniref:AfsA-related hotdog domain-containing protein n=1 Tax=Actinacidiphila sp. ITFR-21 TaxID=3075199 RepID=UPI002889AF17|nr:AfsA-related hotdog domain-containing protein [Streptomyces sp. ITFR-21]WNI16358.1 AfsA-related hotdog domain-containing protein [Streptomyces sp. ITFR-21]
MMQAGRAGHVPHQDHDGPLHPLVPLPGADEWLTDLCVDQTDPFFFDHPLDHVPGMLLVCAMAETVRGLDGLPASSRVKAVVNFRAMPELRPELALLAGPAQEGRRGLRVLQGTSVVADGSVVVLSRARGGWEAEPPSGAAPGAAAGAAGGSAGGSGAGAGTGTGTEPAGGSGAVARAEEVPTGSADPAGARGVHGTRGGHDDTGDQARATLVHRTRPENVMIGEPATVEAGITAAVLLPPPGHALRGPHPGSRPVEALIEAGRQLSVWLSHRLGGWPPDTRILWLKLTADLPAALPSSLRVALHWQSGHIPDDRARVRFDVIAGGGVKVGSLVYVSKAMRPAEYARFRAEAQIEARAGGRVGDRTHVRPQAPAEPPARVSAPAPVQTPAQAPVQPNPYRSAV